MPTYEYACRACARRLEVVQAFGDKPLTKCDECGGKLKRVFHPVGVMFKGSGFYSTDSRNSKAKSAKKDGVKSSDPGTKSKSSKAKTSSSDKS